MVELMRLGSALAALTLAPAPCLAADDARDAGSGGHAVAAFAGASLRLPLGGGAAAKPSTRLQLTTVHYRADRRSSFLRGHRSAGLELGMADGRKPALFLMGEDVAQMKRRLGIGSGSTPLYILGGVAVAVAAAVLLLDGDGSSGEPQPAPPAD
jgi:hypothetical protein